MIRRALLCTVERTNRRQLVGSTSGTFFVVRDPNLQCTYSGYTLTVFAAETTQGFNCLKGIAYPTQSTNCDSTSYWDLLQRKPAKKWDVAVARLLRFLVAMN